HDFCSPLATISSVVAWIAEEHYRGLGDNGLEDMRLLQQSVRRMRALVDTVLRYCGVDADSSQHGWFDGQQMLSSVLVSLREEIRSAEAAVTFDPLPRLFGNRSLLTQVLQKLISNGMRHRASALSPQVHISAREGQREWVISVADNGIGIELNSQAEIFE